MKKLLTTALLLMAGAFMTTALADTYDIWVGDLQVTDSNKGNINPSGKTAGTITFDSNSKRLTFTDVTMSTDKRCIDVEMEGVTVNFNGVNNFTSSASNTLVATRSVTLTGNHASVTFNCTSLIYCAMWLKGGGRISLLYLTAKGTGHAIMGSDDSSQSPTLTTSCCEINATAGGSNIAAVEGFGRWTMEDKGLLLYGRTYNTSSKRTEDKDGNCATSVTLKNGLYVGEQMVRVDAYSSREAVPSGKTAGTITYQNKTLTLDNVTYNGSVALVDNYNVNGLTINSIGTNNINCKSETVMRLRANTTLSGNKLSLSSIDSRDAAAISTYNDCDVTVKMDLLEARGKSFGFYGQSNGALILQKNSSESQYKFAGAESGDVYTGDLQMDGIDFQTESTYYDDKTNYIYYNREISKGFVISTGTSFISTDQITYYPLYIAGIHVNNFNRSDIVNRHITSGKISYSPSTNTLYLEDADCTYDDWIVESYIEDLTIKIRGNNTLTQRDGSSIFRLFNNTTITGGKLTLKGEGRGTIGIYLCECGTLTIKDADIEVAGDGFDWGITGKEGSSLIIDNSDISVSAHTCGCICDWDGITLTNCHIEQPEVSVIEPYAIYGINNHLIGSSSVTETVVIKAGEMTGIDELGVRNEESRVTDLSDAEIYDLSGRRISQLQPGINVIRTKDGKVYKITKK